MPWTLNAWPSRDGLDLAIEQGVVDRMEDAVADPGDDREADEHRVARAGGEAEGSDSEQREAAEQDRPRPEAVDDEARQRLHRARNDEEDGEHEAELGVADVERVLQEEEQRRQQQLVEVADAMGQADQTHHGGVVARRRRGWKRGGGGSHGMQPGHRQVAIVDLAIASQCRQRVNF